MDDAKMSRVEDLVNNGSVFEALKFEYVKVGDVLEYLLHLGPQKVSHNTMIAYKAVCKNSPPQQQYVEDDFFILKTNSEEYIAIYMLIYRDKYLQDLSNDVKLKIAQKTSKILQKLYEPNEQIKHIHLICGTGQLQLNDISPEGKYTLDMKTAKLIVKARSEIYINSFMRCIYTNLKILDKYKKLFIECDYYPLLNTHKYSDLEHDILEHCETVKTKHKHYWENVAMPYWKLIITDNVDTHKPTMPKKTLNKYNILFPDLFGDNFAKMSDLLYNIKLLPKNLQCYILGFPIHHYNPNIEQIQECLSLLEKNGKEKYIEKIQEKNITYLDSMDQVITNSACQTDINVGNEENTLYEKIQSYNIFDIICYYTDKHKYYLTRPEFNNIIETGKNPYTNTEIPDTVLHFIKSRAQLAKIYKLPPSNTIYELLLSVENGSIFNSLKDEESKENIENSLTEHCLNIISDIPTRLANSPNLYTRRNTIGVPEDLNVIALEVLTRVLDENT